MGQRTDSKLLIVLNYVANRVDVLSNSWGGAPIDEGLGTATNEQTGLGGTVYNFDGLHRIDSAGYYAGHPNPIRCNPDSAGLLVGTSFLTSYNAIDSTQSLPYDWPPVDST